MTTCKRNRIPAVYKMLTKTMVSKGNPDCFKSLQQLARILGVDFDSLGKGEKTTLPLVFNDGTLTNIKFYNVTGKGGRKDRRYNIPASVLRAQADVGDTLAFTFSITGDKIMLCVNVTRQPEHNNLTVDDIDTTKIKEAA